MKPLLQKLFISLCSVILTLFILEGIIRYFKLAPVIFDYQIFEPMQFVENPKICYKMKPFGICEGGRLNSEGFKDKEFVIPKGNSLIRIVMLGDSITKGTGISLGETFSDHLEYMLNQKSRSAHSALRYEVMNFGVGGYNIVSEIEVLKIYALKYKPDIVVLNYFQNDNEEYSFNYWFFLDKKDASPQEKNLIYQYYLNSNKFNLQRALLHSHLYTFCWVRINDLLRRWKDIRAQYADYRQDIIKEKLGELKKLSRKNNFKVLICMHPTLDYDKATPAPNYNATLRTARGLGFHCLDLRAAYRNKSPDPAVFIAWPDDKVHPNVAGHEVIAEAILVELEKDRMIP